MVFDLTSFLAGILAGGLTGVLAGILYGFERTADLQEDLLRLRKELESVEPTVTSLGKNARNTDSEKRLRELRAELDAIHQEIRRMYRKSAS